ncbi:MAG: hypothetical protein R3212_03365, partial [Xanthomonadales bacterium]|nr:hypothetical protein [Xanthomonadales bacterium]
MSKKPNSPYVMIIADPRGRRQSALARGLPLARALDCEARVIAFCHESLGGLESSTLKLAERARRSVVRLRQDELEAQLAKNDTAGLKVRSEVVWSKRIHEWVEAECKTHPPVVVVKTGHRTETFRYTPTDWHLIRDCAAPIL